MEYSHKFQVQASPVEVAGFHNRSASMGAITPPPVRVRFHQAPENLAEGAEMDFTLWMGPFPIRWLARIECVSTSGFTDRQLLGPFKEWVHQHTFIPRDEAATLVLDKIHIELKRHPFWALFGLLMWLSLPVLFAFRAWKTRRLLEKR